MHPNLNITDEQLAAYCRKWRIAEFWLFGSILRDDFSPASDVDVMVRYEDDAPWTLFDMSEMKFELQELLGRRVDLLTIKGAQGIRNQYRRRAILDSAQRVYAA